MKFSQLVEQKLRLLEQEGAPMNSAGPTQPQPPMQSPNQAMAGDATAATNTPQEEDLKGAQESSAREEEKVKMLTIIVDILTPIITLSISTESPEIKGIRPILTKIKDIASRAISPPEGAEPTTLAAALSEIENTIKTDYVL